MDPKSIKKMHTFILMAAAAHAKVNNKPSGNYDGNKVVSWSECAWRPKI